MLDSSNKVYTKPSAPQRYYFSGFSWKNLLLSSPQSATLKTCRRSDEACVNRSLQMDHFTQRDTSDGAPAFSRDGFCELLREVVDRVDVFLCGVGFPQQG
jgi:hypothetical protein